MDDRKKVALECARIEQKGGDVLAYLKGMGCISPRGTWYRLQREELGRMEHQMTEGRGRRQNMQRVEVARQLIEAIADGVDPMEKLRELGYKQPNQAYQDIKNTCRKKAPELADQLPERTRGPRKGRQGMKKKEAEKPEPDSGNPETKILNGKEYELAGKPSPACCQPARPSSVTVPEELPGEPEEALDPKQTAEMLFGMEGAKKIYPEKYTAAEVFPEGVAEETPGGLRIRAGQMIQIDGMMIRALEASFGIYEYRNGYLEFKGRNGDAMRLTAARWKEFLAELNRAAALMGVEI